MLDRYATQEITGVLSPLAQLQRCWDVEYAIIAARCELGEIGQDDLYIIDSTVAIDDKLLARALEIETTTGHDVQSFVDAVRELLPTRLQRFVHEHTTSTDTTENAQALMLRQVGAIIINAIGDLKAAVLGLAKEYKYVVRVGRTHGQQCSPLTVGLQFLGWYDLLARWQAELTRLFEATEVGKIRGLVGTYDKHVTPKLEWLALSKLGLKPVDVCGQIIPRDRVTHLICGLATFAGVLENMAVNIRLGAQTEIGEFSEPFAKGRKGSSYAAHKRNTDRSENVTGLARSIRGYAGVQLENIPTWWERDISHSAPERINFDGVFNVMHFMLRRLTGIVAGLVVHKDRVADNLALTKGVIYSGEVKGLLMEYGIEPDEAYKVSQEISQRAWDDHVPFLDLLLADPRLPAHLKNGPLQSIFTNASEQLMHVATIFSRFGI